MLRLAQARNPYSRRWLWIPGSRFARPRMTSLSRGAPTVDGVGGARDVASIVGGKKRHDGGDLRRKPEPARRNPLDDLVIGDRRIAGIAAFDDRAQHPAVDQA